MSNLTKPQPKSSAGRAFTTVFLAKSGLAKVTQFAPAALALGTATTWDNTDKTDEQRKAGIETFTFEAAVLADAYKALLEAEALGLPASSPETGAALASAAASTTRCRETLTKQLHPEL